MWKHSLLIMMYLLSTLFGLGVYVQYVLAALDAEPVPRLESGLTEILPQPMTLVLQLCVMCFLIHLLRGVRYGRMRPRRWKYRACFLVGGPYFLLMLFRWSAELTILAETGSVAKALPLFLHVVVAVFILLLGLHTYVGVRKKRLFRPARYY